MSWWTDLRDFAEGSISKQEGIVGRAMGIPSADDKRKQQQQIADQVKAYKDQTNLANQQLVDSRNATDVQNRLIQEKQIRSLRRNYRSQGVGMLGVGQPANQDMNTSLGG